MPPARVSRHVFGSPVSHDKPVSLCTTLFSAVHEHLLFPSSSVSQDFIFKFQQLMWLLKKKRQGEKNKSMGKLDFVVKICIF